MHKPEQTKYLLDNVMQPPNYWHDHQLAAESEHYQQWWMSQAMPLFDYRRI